MKTISLWQSFGWEFKSTQTVHFKDSHVDYNKGFLDNSVTRTRTTTTTHYVKLTFERDSSIKNYKELVSLEQQYYGVPYPPEPQMMPGRVWMIATGIGLLCYIVPGLIVIGLWVWRYNVYLGKYKLWEQEYSDYKRKRYDILNRVKALG